MMGDRSKPNLLVMVGNGGSAGEADALRELAAAVREGLHTPVEVAFLESGSPTIGEAIAAGVAEHNATRAILLPLFLPVSAAQKNTLALIADAAADRWGGVEVACAEPPGTHAGLVTAYCGSIAQTLKTGAQDVPIAETTLLVIGRGGRDPLGSAETYQMARLMWEAYRFGSVEIAFQGATSPDIAAGIKRCIQTGARRIVVVPYVLFDRKIHAVIETRIQAQAVQQPDIEILLSAPLAVQNGILRAVGERYQAALPQLSVTLRRAGHNHPHGNGTAAIDSDWRVTLPPRYQAGNTVSAAPMAAADLIFDADGRVAWDQIWGDFCDLALAGGPPHRGTLLEPVSPETIAANPGDYARVLAELARGISMITQLPIVVSRSPGWIGMRCTDEAMALWLLRAIIVENISVRREDDVLYFPAGPQFRLEHEIKNVITVVAKTHHYWTEHRAAQ